ncbi:MAG: hypothetical protein Tsb0018_09720 [Opitutales bacterium]
MNKTAKIASLLTLVAGWAVTPVFAGNAIDWGKVHHKANALADDARSNEAVERKQYATELVDFSLSIIKKALTPPVDESMHYELNFLMQGLMSYVSEFYKYSSFYTLENAQRMRAFHDFFEAFKDQVNKFFYSEFEELIEADVEAIKESCRKTVCSSYCYNSSDGEDYCCAYVDDYTNDMYERIQALRNAKFQEKFGKQKMKVYVRLIDEILEDKQA